MRRPESWRILVAKYVPANLSSVKGLTLLQRLMYMARTGQRDNENSTACRKILSLGLRMTDVMV